ncbi:MAG: hypothetical protein DI498_05090 [Paracoccus denitrificans]|nr:MAG: hypothetical protein DI498_05090 [Paracoccus denitrificans]PZO85293.1 MAG: hypothetical protein DI633_05090 [Paracoccus denitrificans]
MAVTFTSDALGAGIWRGRLTNPRGIRRAVVLMDGEAVAQVPVTAEGAEVLIEIPLPARVLGEGVQTLMLVVDDAPVGSPVTPAAQTVGHLSIRAGEPLGEDVLDELATLRAELELLKRQFRGLATL